MESVFERTLRGNSLKNSRDLDKERIVRLEKLLEKSIIQIQGLEYEIERYKKKINELESWKQNILKNS